MRTLVILFGVFVAASAAAQDVPWQYATKNTVRPGEKAEIEFVAKKTFDQVEVALDRADGAKKRVRQWTHKRWKAGKSRVFKWKVPPGKSKWIVTVTGRTGNAGQTANINLTVVAAGPLQVRTDLEGTDIRASKLALVSNQPLARITLEGFDAEGQSVLDQTMTDVDAGKIAIELDSPDGGPLKRLEVKAYDAAAQWVGIRIVSWYAEIPHENVLFETARWEVRPEEGHKIDKVVSKITGELAAFRRMLGNQDARFETLKLYVAGMTDRVGSEADNRALSQKRARAIAGYFRTKGIDAPIFYAGFGERNPAVETVDEVAEPKNRRAMYILSNTTPTTLGRAQWRQEK